MDHALAITRNEFNHVLLECRATENCKYSRIIAAIGLTNDSVYEETADFMMTRLSRVPIHPTSFTRRQREGERGSRFECGRSQERTGRGSAVGAFAGVPPSRGGRMGKTA